MNTYDSMRDWADVRLFLAVHEHGSLVAAAEHLELTQPTVGRRLAALEERFGTPLFVRSGRRMKLTDAGNAILDSARRMQQEMYSIGRAADVQAQGLCGQVTVSATEGTGTEWLTPLLLEFHARYPDILVNMQIENRNVNLVQREADVALRLGQPTQPDLIARRLVRVGFGLYAANSYLDGRRHPVRDLSDLVHHELVGVARTPDRVLSPFEKPLPIPPQARFSYVTNSPAAQIIAVRAGFGIGVVSHRWAAMTPGLVRLLPDLSLMEVDMWLVTHEELRYSARIRAVSEFIAEQVLNDAELFTHGVPPVEPGRRRAGKERR